MADSNFRLTDHLTGVDMKKNVITAVLAIGAMLAAQALAQSEAVIDFSGITTPDGSARILYAEDGYHVAILGIQADGSPGPAGSELRIWPSNSSRPDETIPFAEPVHGNAVYARLPGHFFKLVLQTNGIPTLRLASVDVMNNSFSGIMGRITGFKAGGGTVQKSFTLSPQAAMTLSLPEFADIELTGFSVTPADGKNTSARFVLDNIRIAAKSLPVAANPATKGATATVRLAGSVAICALLVLLLRRSAPPEPTV
jgi:hypothetical protein